MPKSLIKLLFIPRSEADRRFLVAKLETVPKRMRFSNERADILECCEASQFTYYDAYSKEQYVFSRKKRQMKVLWVTYCSGTL